MAEGIWDWGFVWDILPALLYAARITVLATVLAFALALVAGLIFALMRRSQHKWLAVPVAGFVEFIRSTPELVQIYFIFYVFPRFGLVLPPLVAGILALGIHYATYCSECYRAGLDGVSKGQWEASRSLNLSTFRIYKDVVIPQAIPPVVPALGNYAVGMVKVTPLLSAIAVIEILQKAKIIGSHTFRFIEPITLAGIFFLIVSLTAMLIVRRVEAFLNRKILEGG